MNKCPARYSKVTRALANWLRNAREIVVMGIGNPMRRDDYVGMVVVRHLKAYTLPGVHLIETGEVPESYLGVVEENHPSHVLMIDAAEMSEQPGTARLVSPKEIEGLSLSTHTLPLSIISEYIKCRTGAKIALFAIQPGVLEFGEGLSEELSKVVEELANLVVDAVRLSRRKRVRRPRQLKRVQKRSVR